MIKPKKNLGKYVDFKTDFGMKFYFGREENKSILIDFLNDLFAGEKIIKELEYAPNEHDGDIEDDRRVMFDLHCKGADGELFIIEMQQLHQDFFKDRSVYYTSRLISKQIRKGKTGNDYQLPEVYFIALLEFDVNDKNSEQYLYDVALCDMRTNELFYKKLSYKFIVLPNFVKKEFELESDMDQWLFLLKNISSMNQVSKFLDKRIFSVIFSVGEVAKLKKEDLMAYEASLKHRRDRESVNNSARRAGESEGMEKGIEKGIEKGMEKANAENVKRLIEKLSFDNEQVVSFMGVSLDFVKKVRASLEKKK